MLREELLQATTFRIRKSCCSRCLFGARAHVSQARKEEILQECENGFFICHEATLQQKVVCCRAFYDRYKNSSTMLQFAQALNDAYPGSLQFIEIEDSMETSTKNVIAAVFTGALQEMLLNYSTWIQANTPEDQRMRQVSGFLQSEQGPVAIVETALTAIKEADTTQIYAFLEWLNHEGALSPERADGLVERFLKEVH